MRHGVKGRKLGRTASHRAATLNLLATSLLKHKNKTTQLRQKSCADSSTLSSQEQKRIPFIQEELLLLRLMIEKFSQIYSAT